MENMNLGMVKLILFGVGCLIIVLFLAAINPIVVVGAGERGVVFNNTSGVENRILSEGMHLRVPLIEHVTKMSVRTQATTFDESGANSAGTQDSQQVDVKVTINWHIDPDKVNIVYQKIGNNDAIVSNILNNNVQESIKQSISKYQALEVQKNRDQVASSTLQSLQDRLKPYNILVENVSITNFSFSQAFNDAIEQAQVQQQNAKAAEYAVQTAKNQAESIIATAKGNAEAQQLLQQALTPELLQKMAIDKWDGKLPTTMIPGATTPFIGVK